MSIMHHSVDVLDVSKGCLYLAGADVLKQNALHCFIHHINVW